jgi:hypothetical protein
MSNDLLAYSNTAIQSAILNSSIPHVNVAQALDEPDLFAEYFLQTDLWDIQRKILQALKKSRRVAVKACHASSKTYTAARALLWFLASFEKSTVVTTAPTWIQVEKLLWGEVHSALTKSRYPFPKPLKTELSFAPEFPKREAYGLSTSVTNQDEGVKFQGIHNDHVLIILDEAPGVEPKIWQAVDAAMSAGNAKVLAIGNPTWSSGPFHDAFTKARFAWNCFTINAFDTPNFVDIPHTAPFPVKDNLVDKDGKVIEGSRLDNLLKIGKENDAFLDADEFVRPYLTRRRWVYELYYTCGPGHPYWEARVLGEFPKQDEFALISLDWLEKAKVRELNGTGKVSAGIDVAGGGSAETVLCVRRGPQIIELKFWPISDPRGEIVAVLNKYRGELQSVNVDSIGVGYYLYKHLEEIGFPANPIIAQATSSDSEKYRTLKDEFYWGLRLRLEQGDFSGLDDETTIGQLAGIRYKHNSRGQVEIESKDEAKKRGVPSPDRAEAVMLAFGTHQVCYGVLDAQRQEKMQMEKVQSSVMIKPTTSDSQLSCPECQAICIAPCQGGWRCGQCGHQWNSKPNVISPQTRGDYLAKAEVAKSRL